MIVNGTLDHVLQADNVQSRGGK